jgi:hypothetical protein
MEENFTTPNEILLELQKEKINSIAEEMLDILNPFYSSTITLDSSHGFQSGDAFTISGHFKKRTFFQWLLRKKKQLIVYRIGDVESGTEITIKPPFMRIP